MQTVNAGRLNKRVDIYSYQETTTDTGASKSALTKTATVYAELRPMRGNEFLEYYRDANELLYKITIRYRESLTEKDVLVYHDRQFQITSIINIEERNAYMEVFCTEMKDKKVLYGGD